ncbi:ABC-type uncharacterized transport system, periplasmic component [Pelotomaculum thermopropionicum SI]|uniref:ABC-type uncharacterized transport system, periplasmic component n=1 Tax=Pelotomaculum thermopropionicum (strain DSM 13744 / JCM 10971 / SI) TaxID=370438 RepID=A5CZW7_PELTS|nr:ABC-type uncharacterized transport system, periplasmic component [Pelotomaculum thermopropionicum SI]
MMKRPGFNQIIIIVFYLTLCIFLVGFNLSKPRVLVIHSYDPDYSWVGDVNKGINEVLGKKPLSVKYFYLDIRRHPDTGYMTNAGIAARNLVNKWKPGVIIAVDDEAQMLVGKYFVNHPSINIVFAGVEGILEEYGYDSAVNVTGIFEKIQLDALRDTMVQILPEGRRRIAHISDASQPALFSGGEINSYTWKPLELKDSTRCRTFDDWKKAVLQAQDNADILLLTDYHSIRRSPTDKSIVPPREIIQWTEQNSRLPGISYREAYVEDGGMMAVCASPLEQGRAAAEMALEIVEKGVKPLDIFFRENRLYIVHIRESGVKSHHITMPGMLEAFARATGHYY